MKLLEGKKALIAGVANKQSLAWGIAQALHEHGAELAFSCVENNVRRLKKLTPEVGSEFIIPCDVQKDEDIDNLFVEVDKAWGGLDILVHSIAFARFEDLEGEFVKTPRDAFALAADVSAYSLVALARGARPLMKKSGGGSIITLSFDASHRIIPNYNVMAAAKAALETSALYLAGDLGKDGIRVNVLSAGVVRTASSSAIKGLDSALTYLETNNIIGRNITKEDLGGPAVFLCSDLSRAVTAHTLFVDGGARVLTGH